MHNQQQVRLKVTNSNQTPIVAKSARSSLAIKTLRRFAFLLLISVTTIYLCLCLALVGMESRLVFPAAYTDDVVERINTPTQPAGGMVQISTVEYCCADDEPLAGRLCLRQNASRIVLFFHGNGTKAAGQDRMIQNLSDALDAHMLAAEYRGFAAGDSRTPSETGLVADGIAACDLLCEKFSVQPDEIIVYGRSIGGGVACAVAADRGAKTLILERTFARLVDIPAETYWYIPIRILMHNPFDSLQRLQKYSGPLLLIHGQNDQLIPVEHAKDLHQQAVSTKKELLILSNLGHNDRLPSSVFDFIRMYL